MIVSWQIALGATETIFTTTPSSRIVSHRTVCPFGSNAWQIVQNKSMHSLNRVISNHEFEIWQIKRSNRGLNREVSYFEIIRVGFYERPKVLADTLHEMKILNVLLTKYCLLTNWLHLTNESNQLNWWILYRTRNHVSSGFGSTSRSNWSHIGPSTDRGLIQDRR